MTREELVTECRFRSGRGDAIDDIIDFLRSSGCWKTESIAVIAAACTVGLAKAKELVHFSDVWKDTRSSDEQFHEMISEAVSKSQGAGAGLEAILEMHARLFFALLCGWLAPIAAALALGLFYTIQLGAYPDALWFILGNVAMVAGVVSAVILLIFGIPTYLIFQSCQLFSRRAYVLAGAAFSLIVVILMSINQMGFANRLQPEEFWLFIVGAILSGPLAAFTFWTLRRPDKGQWQGHNEDSVR